MTDKTLEPLPDDLDWDKYSDESVNYIFSESEKYLNETIAAFRKCIDRSYAVIAFYLAMVSFSFTALSNAGFQGKTFPVLLELLASGVCIFLIHRNLLGSHISWTGAKPTYVLHSYFEDPPKETQLRRYKIHRIKAFHTAINRNEQENELRHKRLNTSIVVFLLITLLAVISMLYLQWGQFFFC